MKFEGIYTPVLTPYDDNHAINFDDIEPMIENLIDSGVHGIVVAGTTGEYYTQDTKERLQVMKTCNSSISDCLSYLHYMKALFSVLSIVSASCSSNDNSMKTTVNQIRNHRLDGVKVYYMSVIIRWKNWRMLSCKPHMYS